MTVSDPIIILGILGRSGTNFLSRLLDLHPACSLAADIPEDWLLVESHYLAAFTKAVGRRWKSRPEWQIDPDYEHKLREHIGRGLLQFLGESTGNKRLITKTPSVQNLPLFFGFFPKACLLILVRDGRDVVESAVRSFAENPYKVARWWNWAAGAIIDFDSANRNGIKRYNIVRYEDLLLNTTEEMKKILDFLGLDLDSYPFDRAREMPIFGSCNFRNKEGDWQWQVKAKADDFNPVKRWKNWNRKMHERINWIAGAKLEAFHYEPRRYTQNRCLWYIRTSLWAGANLLMHVLDRIIMRKNQR